MRKIMRGINKGEKPWTKKEFDLKQLKKEMNIKLHNRKGLKATGIFYLVVLCCLFRTQLCATQASRFADIARIDFISSGNSHCILFTFLNVRKLVSKYRPRYIAGVNNIVLADICYPAWLHESFSYQSVSNQCLCKKYNPTPGF